MYSILQNTCMLHISVDVTFSHWFLKQSQTVSICDNERIMYFECLKPLIANRCVYTYCLLHYVNMIQKGLICMSFIFFKSHPHNILPWEWYICMAFYQKRMSRSTPMYLSVWRKIFDRKWTKSKHEANCISHNSDEYIYTYTIIGIIPLNLC